MWARRWEGGVGWSAAQAATTPATVEVEGRARTEHTPNVDSMSLTLNVSRLSGWLNADASCRVEKREA